jgi:tetratricopeptide (TPR) repeat protein
LLLGGDPQGALAAFEDGERLAANETVTPFQQVTLLARRAECYAAVGRLDDALALSEQAAALAASTRRLPAADAYLARARVLLAMPDAPEAEIVRMLDDAAEITRHCAAGVYDAPIHEERARLARRAGRAEDAAREVEAALRRYREIGATGHVARLAGSPEQAVSAA